MHYRGIFLDGKEFDTSYGIEMPFRFILGVGAVIKSWDMVEERLSVGEKIKIAPYNLAYREKGFSGIPLKTDIIFEIELVKFEEVNDL